VLPCRVIQQSHFTLGALGDRLTLNTFRDGPALPIPCVVTSSPLFFPRSFLLSLLAATLMHFPVSIANKGLMSTLNPLDATHTKNRGWVPPGHTPIPVRCPDLSRLFATLTKTPGVWGYSSHSGTRRIRPPLRIPNFMQAPSFHSFPNSFPTLSQTHPDTGKEPLSPPVAESSSHVSP
jgi:hypothetical protein